MKGQKGFVQVAPTALDVPVPGWARAVAARVGRWLEVARQRRQLASLSDAALHDLGLSRADIMLESERPFWDDPPQK